MVGRYTQNVLKENRMRVGPTMSERGGKCEPLGAEQKQVGNATFLLTSLLQVTESSLHVTGD